MLSVPHTPQADEAADRPAYRSAGAARGGRAELDGDDVELLLGGERRVGAVGDGAQVVGRGEHALGVQEAGGELEVVARGAHRDRDPVGGAARPGQPDLERLLGREPVLVPRATGARPAPVR